jgi:hypothetical protein
LAFFLVEGAAYQFNKRMPTVAVEGDSAHLIDSADKMFWLNDGVSRIIAGVLAYFMVNTINTYLTLIIFSVFTFLGHAFVFSVLTLNLGGFFFMSSSFLISLGSGGFWVLVASIIIDDGGIKNFGLNWGNAVFFNLLGILFYTLLTYYINFKSEMGVVFLITGTLTLVFSILAWFFDRKSNRSGGYQQQHNQVSG